MKAHEAGGAASSMKTGLASMTESVIRGSITAS